MSSHFHTFLIPPEQLPNPGAIAYRYQDMRGAYCHYDWDGEPCGISSYYTQIYLTECIVTRYTPKGFFIEWFNSNTYEPAEKFIAHGWRKKYACLSIPEARESYRRRKLAQHKILSRQIGSCEVVLNSIENDKWEGKCIALRGTTPREKMLAQYDLPDWLEPN